MILNHFSTGTGFLEEKKIFFKRREGGARTVAGETGFEFRFWPYRRLSSGHNVGNAEAEQL